MLKIILDLSHSNVPSSLRPVKKVTYQSILLTSRFSDISNTVAGHYFFLYFGWTKSLGWTYTAKSRPLKIFIFNKSLYTKNFEIIRRNRNSV